jgi:adenylate cyclase
VDRWYQVEVLTMTEEVNATPLPTNPLINWMIKSAWASASISDLVATFATELIQTGVPLLRLSLHIRTLHPLLAGTGFVWHRGRDEVLENVEEHGVFKSARFLKSAMMPIYEGASGVRRRLSEEDQPFDFPVLEEIYREGGTDYVAMPFLFSDGQINAITLSSYRTEGFSTQELGHVNEVLPLLGRLVEVFASRYKSETLLETYLGRQAGREVLNGMIKHGDGRDIHAVIWFCDLRESTALADAVSRTEFLQILNEFFDCMAGAVIRHGGEVLRFIGDAALAIFPVDEAVVDSYQDGGNACTRALKAASDAAEKIRQRNGEAAARGGRGIDFGIGLHIGDVTYGNIGTDSRLEFTVIGAAVNETTRIEGLCKATGEAVLVSAEFVRQHPGAYRPLGIHRMAGVGREIEVFAPVDPIDVSQ